MNYKLYRLNYHLLLIILFITFSQFWVRKFARIVFNDELPTDTTNTHILQGSIIIFLLFSILYLITNSMIASSIIGNLFLYIFNFANIVKFEQRGETINFNEFREILNIKSLSDLVPLEKIFIILVIAIILSITIIIVETKYKRLKKLNYHIGIRSFFLILIISLLIPFFIDSEQYTKKFFDFNTKTEKEIFEKNNPKEMGFIPYFMNNISRQAMKNPNVDRVLIQKYIKKYEQKARINNLNRHNDIKKEHTIIYLSESLWDSNKLLLNGPSIPFIKKMQTTYGGQMYSQFIGGGTGNIEFSILTSMSLELHKNPTLTTPYVDYFGKGKSSTSIMSLFKSNEKTVVHPYNFSYYNRPGAYKAMGITKKYDQKTMKYTNKLPGSIRISDESLTKFLLDNMGKYKMINAISMQNHSPYSVKQLKNSEYQPEFVPGILSTKPTGDAYGDYQGLAASYFRGARESDKAIQHLIDRMNKSNKKINLILYGDHGPSFLRGKEKKLGKVIHETPYFIYQNHNHKNTSTIANKAISPMFIVPEMLERGKYKMPPFYYLINDLNKNNITRIGMKYVYINDKKVMDKDLDTHLKELVDFYRAINYDRYFGKNTIGDKFFIKY
ncbi:LTA synthase family protein [Macrococcus animalis]|uniref:LTA synthase family protein n=1 Tax=Macrococcus animalis TaxID=3395467 RepID=UPI0039BDB353